MAVLKVLVIDDEPGIRSGVTRILRDFHVTYPFMDEDYTFELLEAPTGEDGIAVIEHNKPDFIPKPFTPQELKKEGRIRQVNLAEVASGAIFAVRPYTIQREVSINLDVKSETTIVADPADMEIIFNNLISNAVKYNKIGGMVDITIEATESEALTKVSDTGIGIKKSDTENLFTEFVRIKNEKTRDISGSELGLSIVKKVAELYFGTIEVDSTPDVGSVFTVRLPKKSLNIN